MLEGIVMDEICLRIFQIGILVFELWLCFELLGCMTSDKKKKPLLLIESVVFCVVLIAQLDLSLAFFSMTFLKQDFFQEVLNLKGSIWQIFILLISRILVMNYILMLKSREESIQENMQDFLGILTVFDLVYVALLWSACRMMWKISIGEQQMKGILWGMVYLTAVTVLVAAETLYIRSRIIQKRNEFLHLQEEWSKQYYQEMDDFLDGNRKMTRGIKDDLQKMDEYARNKKYQELHQYMEKICGDFLETERKDYTGNTILDMVLSYKISVAEQAGITVDVHTVSTCGLALSDHDICALFGNLMDNAIEACSKIQDKERWIQIKIEQQRAMFFIEIVNSIAQMPQIQNERFQTSKEDKSIHGYGLKSVKYIVDKYEGVFTCKVEKDRFYADVSFLG